MTLFLSSAVRFPFLAGRLKQRTLGTANGTLYWDGSDLGSSETYVPILLYRIPSNDEDLVHGKARRF